MWLNKFTAPLLGLLLSASALQAGAQQVTQQVTPAVIQETASATAPAPPELTAADLNDWLDGFMPNALANADVVGAVVTIVHNGEIIANRGYGYSNLETRTPVDPNTTLFRPGSISKLFAWTAVMQLVEQGKIDLDADVNTYLDFEIPDYQGQPITMRQIMTHTTGFEEVLRNLIVTDVNAVGLERYVKTHTPVRVYPPGTMPAYSNYATAVAGYVVQRLSGETFEDYVQHHIFDPLGMRHSTFVQPLPEEMQSAMSLGYRNRRSGEPQDFEIVPGSPAGAASVTGADMALFMNAHLADGAGLMRPETARLMHEFADQQFPAVNPMALGFYHDDWNGEPVIGHGGDTGPFHSNLSLLTNRDVGVFISMNSAGAGTPVSTLLRWNLLHGFIDRYFPGPAVTEPVALPTAREHGAAFVGDFEGARRVDTNPLYATSFFTQLTVKMLPNGDLVGPSLLPEANGAPTHWREVEPWVWQAVGGAYRLGARVENGRVVAYAVDPVAFAISYMRAPWWRSKSLLVPLICVALGAFALTLLSWPVRAVARRAYGARFPYEGQRALAHRMSAVAALLAFVYLGLWVAIPALLYDADVGNGGVLIPLYVAGIIPIAIVAGLGYLNWTLWRAPSSWFAKAWGVVLLLSAIVLLWFAVALRLYSFDITL